MSDDKKKKADEIVNEVAAEMGVENETVPESDESADDVMAGLGGIFDVPKRKKKKKKKKPAAEADEASEVSEVEDEVSEVEDEVSEVAEDDASANTDDEESAEDASNEDDADEPEAEEAEATSKKSEKKPEKAKKSKKKKAAGIDGVFQPSGDTSDAAPADYLDEDDLGDFEPSQGSMKPYIIAVAAVALVGIGAVFAVGGPDDLVALFKGEYKERKIAEARQAEEEYREKQLAAQNRFGNLLVSGYPKYATIKLNGEVQYGMTSSEEWRALRLGSQTAFQGLDAKEPHTVEISNPGFETKTVELTPGMWSENPSGGDVMYALDGTLAPSSQEDKSEFEARLAPDVDSDYFGKVTINTIPSGAKVIFNNHPLLDKDGNELRTPVTFEHNYVRDEDSGKLEEREVRVDTIIDQGHKIQLQMPEEAGEYPNHVMALQRQMWTCQPKSERELRGYNPDRDSPQKRCDYVFTYDFSFDALKAYIERREAEMKAVEEHNRKQRELAGESVEEDDE